MITKDHVNAFLTRLACSRRFDQHDYDELKTQISEKLADKYARTDLIYTEGLLELSDKVKEFLLSLEVE